MFLKVCRTIKDRIVTLNKDLLKNSDEQIVDEICDASASPKLKDPSGQTTVDCKKVRIINDYYLHYIL